MMKEVAEKKEEFVLTEKYAKVITSPEELTGTFYNEMEPRKQFKECRKVINRIDNKSDYITKI